ncbi:MAG: hypothetical protein JWN23_1058 [Rhodocyclales bacterium]|nr:hypothetical protein [Rhodocyclales bacterium]
MRLPNLVVMGVVGCDKSSVGKPFHAIVVRDLEPPGPDEFASTFSGDAPPIELATHIIEQLRAKTGHSSGAAGDVRRLE